MLKDIFSDGIFALFNKIGYFGIKTIIIVLITRELGNQYGGVFILLIGALEVVRVIADFGVDIYVIRMYNCSDGGVRLLKRVLIQKLFIGVITVLLFCIICHFLKYPPGIYFPVSLSLFFALFFNLSNSYFQSQNSNRVLTPAIIFSLVFCVIVFLVQYTCNIHFSVWNYLLVECVFVTSVTFLLMHKVGYLRFVKVGRVPLNDALSLYRHTANIGFNAMIVIIYSRLDNFYIKHLDPESLATYGQIFRLIDPLVMVSSVFSTVAYAKFSHINLRSNNDFSKIKPFLFAIIGYVILSSFVYYFVLLFFGHYLILDDANKSAMIIGFLVVAGIKCYNGALTSIIQSQGLYHFGLYIAIVCIIVAIPAMYLFINAFGVIGAIYSIITVELISMLLLALSILFLKRRDT